METKHFGIFLCFKGEGVLSLPWAHGLDPGGGVVSRYRGGCLTSLRSGLCPCLQLRWELSHELLQVPWGSASHEERRGREWKAGAWSPCTADHREGRRQSLLWAGLSLFIVQQEFSFFSGFFSHFRPCIIPGRNNM